MAAGVSGSDMGGWAVVARGWQAVSGGRQGVAGSGRRVARGQERGRPWQAVAGRREAAAEGGSQWSWGGGEAIFFCFQVKSFCFRLNRILHV